MRTRVLALSAAALLAVACSSNAPAPVQKGSASESIDPAAPLAARLAAGGNAFSVNLYNALAESEAGNVVVSPLSVSLAFGLLYPGAGGDTAGELASALGYGVTDADAFVPAMRGWSDALQTERENSAFKIANAAWVSQTLPLNTDYRQRIEQGLGARIEAIDVLKPAESAATINTWVSNKTNRRIDQLVSADTITPDTALIVTNAVWFKAKWASEFAPHRTHDHEFTQTDGTKQSMRLMNQTSYARYLEKETYKVIDLDYRDDQFALTVLLPNSDSGLPALQRKVTPEFVTTTLKEIAAAKTKEVTLGLPKLKTRSTLKLANPLQQLGMEQAFSDRADFSGISNANLAVSDVIQKTFLEIDEEGTEAAAATAIAVELTSGRVGPPPPEFIADHPFLFVLRHKPTGTILFLGRIEEIPQE